MKKIILLGLIVLIGGGLFFWMTGKKEKEVVDTKTIELTGMIEKIGEKGDVYRYYLKLDKPFVDKVGEMPAINYIEIPLMVRYADWQGKEEILEEKLGEKVTIKGEIEWGQGETRHFLMKEIEGVKL